MTILVAKRRVSVIGLALIAAVCGSCVTILEPTPLPTDAVEIAAPLPFARWWTLVEQCSGRSAPMSEIHWFVVPGSAFTIDGTDYDGMWFRDGNKILLAQSALYHGSIVRHEMLHAILQRGSHPYAEFADHCGGVVSFGDDEQLAPSLALPPLDADTPKIDAHALVLGVNVSPTTVAQGLPDSGWVTITVSVTNPFAIPVLVRVRPLHPDQNWGETFGYEREIGGLRGWAAVYVSRDSLVPFAAHETKRHVFDEQVYGIGEEWRFRGYFNTDTAPSQSVVVH